MNSNPECLNDGQRLWGIMGGMGPRSSAEFVKTIYDLCRSDYEQATPPLILWSDPRIPDRTNCLLNGGRDLLLESLRRGLQRLVACDVTDIIICCVTIHHLIAELPALVRARIVSLVDVIIESVIEGNQQYLLVCTNGTRKIALFEEHHLWHQAQDRIVRPSAKDQERIHQLIYRIKQYRPLPEDVHFLNELTAAYQVDSFIAGCTEIHVLVREYDLASSFTQKTPCLDPLMILAESISRSVRVSRMSAP